jgi:hypothetical protein
MGNFLFSLILLVLQFDKEILRANVFLEELFDASYLVFFVKDVVAFLEAYLQVVLFLK